MNNLGFLHLLIPLCYGLPNLVSGHIAPRKRTTHVRSGGSVQRLCAGVSAESLFVEDLDGLDLPDIVVRYYEHPGVIPILAEVAVAEVGHRSGDGPDGPGRLRTTPSNLGCTAAQIRPSRAIENR